MFEINIGNRSGINTKPIIIKVSKVGCWECVSHKCNDSGYIIVQYKGKGARLHRVLYEKYVSEISAENPFILHRCDNPKCCNPKHLMAGTQADNIKDMVSKNRQAKGLLKHNSKLGPVNIIKIRQLYKEGLTQERISKLFGVNQSRVSRIVNKKTWKHIN